jgi:hypothetical protein
MHNFAYSEGNAPLRCPSPSDAVDLLFHRALGPTVYLFNSFEPATQLKAHEALIALLRDCLTGDGAVDLARDYLLVRATRNLSERHSPAVLG